MSPAHRNLALLFPGILLMMTAVHAPAADRPPRAALAAAGGDTAELVVALAETRLSTQAPAPLELLERKQIRRVMAEQKLAMDGHFSPADSIRAGQLLACDLFAGLHVAADGSASLVAFDARSGLRLADTTLPAEPNPETLAGKVAAELAAACVKWQNRADPARLRTVSFLSTRNLTLPRQHAWLADGGLQTLLERELMAAPDMAVLERQRLDQVNRETGISATAARDTLLASAILLELDLSAGGKPDAVNVRVSFNDRTGRELATVSHVLPTSALAESVRELAAKIRRGAGAPPESRTPEPSVAQRVAEAARFLAETQWQPDTARQVASVEAALALNPRLQPAVWQACNLYARLATERAGEKKWAEALAAAEEAGDLLPQMNRRTSDGSDAVWNNYEPMLARLMHAGPEMGAAEQGRLRQEQARYRQLAGKLLPDPTRESPRGVLQRMYVSSTSADDWFERLAAYFPVWLAANGEGYDTAPWHDLYPQSPFMNQNPTWRRPDYRSSKDHPEAMIYTVRDLSPQNRQRLFQFHNQVFAAKNKSDATRVLHRLSAINLALAFPQEFPDFSADLPGQLRAVGDFILARAREEGAARKPAGIMAEEWLWHVVDPWDDPRLPRETCLMECYRVATGLAECGAPCKNYLYLLGGEKERFDPKLGAELAAALAKARRGTVAVKPAEPAWRRQERVTEVAPQSGILTEALSGDLLYLVSLPRPAPPQTLPPGTEVPFTLHRVNLRSRTAQDVGAIRAANTFNQWRSGNTWHNQPPVLEIGATCVYLNGFEAVMAFPLDGTAKPRVIRGAMPDRAVTALREFDGWLYVAVTQMRNPGAGGLCRCRPDGSDWQVLADSGRRETLSALDNCPSYTITAIVPDAGHRSLLLVGSGLAAWELFPETRQIRPVAAPPPGITGGDGKSAWLQPDGQLFATVNPTIWRWNWETRVFELRGGKHFAKTGFFEMSLMPGPEASRVAERNGALFVSDENSRKILRFRRVGGKTEKLALPGPDGYAPPRLLVWNGQLLTVSANKIWLLSPPEDDVSGAAAGAATLPQPAGK